MSVYLVIVGYQFEEVDQYAFKTRKEATEFVHKLRETNRYSGTIQREEVYFLAEDAFEDFKKTYEDDIIESAPPTPQED